MTMRDRSEYFLFGNSTASMEAVFDGAVAAENSVELCV
jgi:hypothetical protein